MNYLLKKVFSGFIYKMFMKLGNEVTAKFLDDLKDLVINMQLKQVFQLVLVI